MSLDNTTICICCSSTNTTKFLFHNINTFKCHNCDLVFTESKNSSLDYNSAYCNSDSIYNDHLKSLDCFQTTDKLSESLLPFENICIDILKTSVALKDIVVDIGCGVGRFLRAAESHCCNAIGYELSETIVHKLLHHGRTARHGGISDFINDNIQNAGGISLFEVIEHLETPRSAINTIYQRAKPKFLFVVVPDSYTRRKYDPVFFQNDVPPNHLSWWTLKSLTALLKNDHYKLKVQRVPETRRNIKNLFKKRHNSDSNLSVLNWAAAYLFPPSFWLLGVAERLP